MSLTNPTTLQLSYYMMADTKKILLVDDDPLSLQIMQVHLNNSGEDFEIFVAENGKEALEVASNEVPDLIISDWEMPVMTGIEMTRAVKADPKLKNIPIIVATGIMTTDNNLDQAFQAGAIDYVRKPVNEIELIARMRSVLALIEYQERIRIQNEILKEHREELKAINTELTESNLRLRESEMRYKHLADATLEGIAICSPRGIILNHNKQLSKILRTVEENNLNEDIYQWLPQPEWGDSNFIHDEFEYPSEKDKRIISLHSRKIQYQNEDAVIVTIRDITAAKRIEQLEKQRLEDKISNEKEINRLQKEKYEADLAHKNRQLTSTTLQINNKNKILEEISNVLQELTSTSISNPSKQYRKLSMIIKDNLNLDKDWEQFKLHFDEVHPDFFEELKKRYPSLTETDLKHCAYMRIGFSTKEIARLLNVTPRSVQVSRYRMKKKMNLPEEVDLREVIKSV